MPLLRKPLALIAVKCAQGKSPDSTALLLQCWVHFYRLLVLDETVSSLQKTRCVSSSSACARIGWSCVRHR